MDERRLTLLRVIRAGPVPYEQALVAYQCQTGESGPQSAEAFAGLVRDLIAVKWIDFTPKPEEGGERALWLRPRGEAILGGADPGEA